MDIGTAEGMALYLNGTELPAEVYRNNDVNELIALLDFALVADNDYRKIEKIKPYHLDFACVASR